MPYARFGDPQTINLYTFGLNNPFGRIDPDGHDPWDLVRMWLNVVEVKLSASVGYHVEGQLGALNGEAHATAIGSELTLGLGGKMSSNTTSGVGASGSVGPAKVEVGFGANLSSKDGANVGAKASGNVGSYKASAGASGNEDGASTSTSTSLKGPQVKQDTEIGVSAGAGIGLGISLNLTAAGQAWDTTVQDVQDIGDYLNTLLAPPTPSSQYQQSLTNRPAY